MREFFKDKTIQGYIMATFFGVGIAIGAWMFNWTSEQVTTSAAIMALLTACQARVRAN